MGVISAIGGYNFGCFNSLAIEHNELSSVSVDISHKRDKRRLAQSEKKKKNSSDWRKKRIINKLAKSSKITKNIKKEGETYGAANGFGKVHCNLDPRGLLATDSVILNYRQVTRMTPDLAPVLTTTLHRREDVRALYRFNVHCFPTRWLFSGTRLELMTSYLYHYALNLTTLKSMPDHHPNLPEGASDPQLRVAHMSQLQWRRLLINRAPTSPGYRLISQRPWRTLEQQAKQENAT
ncbi:hypothetical protein TNCV_2338961 [Trichonephila clavipes]|nr:hypothetical protein TNCV_2338961 [Trichonephila clavipes]